MESKDEGKQLFPIKTVARLMGISYSGFAQAVREGRVPAVRRGGDWYVTLDSIVSAAAAGTIRLPPQPENDSEEDNDDDDEHD